MNISIFYVYADFSMKLAHHYQSLRHYSPFPVPDSTSVGKEMTVEMASGLKKKETKLLLCFDSTCVRKGFKENVNFVPVDVVFAEQPTVTNGGGLNDESVSLVLTVNCFG